jgi:hypothetical protein
MLSLYCKEITNSGRCMELRFYNVKVNLFIFIS